MEEIAIMAAINEARKGIKQYLEIMHLFPKIDVSINREFQRKYNNLYRVRQRNEQFYQTYYQYMQYLKGKPIEFKQVIEYFYSKLNRFEPSFSSKLVATHNPNLPIWDTIVLENIGIKPPSYNSAIRMIETIATYEKIKEWYKTYQKSKEGQLIIELFNDAVEDSFSITDLKKIDFVLWQIRPKSKNNKDFIIPGGRKINTCGMNSDDKLDVTDLNSIIIKIRHMFLKAGSQTKIPLRRGNRTFSAKLYRDGISVDNLGSQPFLPWSAFKETVKLLQKNGGRARCGDAMNYKLGEVGLSKDSIEGHIAHVVYGKQDGDIVFRRISPIAGILIWAGICEAIPRELILLSNFSGDN